MRLGVWGSNPLIVSNVDVPRGTKKNNLNLIIMKSIEILFAQLNAGYDVIDLFVHNIDCFIDTYGIEGMNDLPSEVASAYEYFSRELDLV
jgi:hypothetical protein